VRAFARARRVEIEWVRFRWPSLLTDLQDKRFDVAISGLTIGPGRSIAGRFSLPLTTSSALVLVPEASALRRVSDLNRHSVALAVNAGGHLERVARRVFPQARIEAVDRNQDVLSRLTRGSALGVVTDSLEAPHWQAQVEGLIRIGPLTQDRKAALFDPARVELAGHFDAWLLEAEASGELARLRERHGLPAERTADPGWALLAGLDERLSLMICVARVKSLLELDVEDSEREQRVLEAAWRSVEEAAQAAHRKPPPEPTVRRLFRAQIEAAKWIQTQALVEQDEAWLVGTPNPRAEARRQLDGALRPALLRIGARISALLVRAEARPQAGLDFAQTRRALARHGLPDAHLRALHEALVSLLQASSPDASAPLLQSAAPDTDPNA
jgi:cyclohexadienyl dehydratase